MQIETNRFLGYPDRLSLPAGERISFHLSSSDDQAAVSIVRMRCADPDPRGPGLRYEVMNSAIDGIQPCRHQPIRPGSAVIVDDRGALAPGRQFSLGCYIWPTRLTPESQTIMSRFSAKDNAGYALAVSRDKGLTFTACSAAGAPVEFSLDIPLAERNWYWVAASFDEPSGQVTLAQVRLADGIMPETRVERRFEQKGAWRLDSLGPFVIAARATGHGGEMAHHFDGKIDSPRVAGQLFDQTALRAVEPAPRTGSTNADVLAFWDFSIGIDTLEVTDLSASRLNGRLHQLPRRAVTGVNWSGAVHDWRLSPKEYGAIHFHTDDLYDCGWDPDFSLDIPEDWRSGVYALRLRRPQEAGSSGAELTAESFVPFFVTPAPGRKRAKLVVIASTATYLAYANSALRLYHVHFQGLMEHLLQLTYDDIYLQEHPELGQSTYDSHIDQSGRCYSSWLRPILNIRPRANPFNLCTDTHFLDWLEEKGIEYDLITDIELDREGVRSVSPYRVVCTPSHPEYYSVGMMNALMAYQNQGGRHLSLGANGFYWRCAFHPAAPAALEVRRGMAGTRTWESQPGEVHLAGTGEPAALWRHSGFAPQKLVGAGFSAMINDRPGYFMRTPESSNPRVGFIVDGIEQGERIGDFGVRLGGAVGIEIDRFDLELGSPPHSIVVATSYGLGAGALPTPEEFRTMVHGLDGEHNALVRADMVFFETPNGGAVFTTGSISYMLSLSVGGYENNVSHMTKNVLTRFLSDEPFTMPD
ncbi:N,N-dimethylformamidase [Corticibacterium sp. UT-5YL-CI-8]|nr:N,N-dimethylformamidase [Tianweitania sp. UT-5YL-CI-8]